MFTQYKLFINSSFACGGFPGSVIYGRLPSDPKWHQFDPLKGIALGKLLCCIAMRTGLKKNVSGQFRCVSEQFLLTLHLILLSDFLKGYML